MKTIIAGSRTIKDYNQLYKAIVDSQFEITEVVCGMAEGVDSLGEAWAIENNIPVKLFKADWNRYGKRAGHYRNYEMGNYAEALICLHDGVSRGSMDMVNIARKNGLKIYYTIIKATQ